MPPGKPGEFWRGRRVFITGTTGFKGSWLALVLRELGARVEGYALAPDSIDSLFTRAEVNTACPTTLADIRDLDQLTAAVRAFAPQTIFHLAAQPLVRRSYAQPLETFSTNVQGTCNLLEAARGSAGLESVIVVTTDKCYRNREWDWGYRETDELGGDDPYSASKAAAELAVGAWRASYYRAAGIGLATARAGNVVGGGDWAEDRLIPDIVRAYREQRELVVRYPEATRPWQHVLDCVHGYLLLAEHLHAHPEGAARAWNFGPPPEGEASVRRLIGLMSTALPVQVAMAEGVQQHEAARLVLDSTLAHKRLGWRTALDLQQTLEWTAEWYAAYLRGETASHLTLAQIRRYLTLCGRAAT
jgi:CDP-glucose 4,6-dehydratase